MFIFERLVHRGCCKILYLLFQINNKNLKKTRNLNILKFAFILTKFEINVVYKGKIIAHSKYDAFRDIKARSSLFI